VLSGIFLGGGPTVAPPSPSALVASPASPYQVNLRWTGAVSSAEYSIERSRDGVGNWITVGTAAMASYSDTGLGQGTAYYYRVRASNAIGTSNPSSTASATTTTPTLGYTQAPQGNWVGAYGIDGNALLGWNGGADLISWPKGGIAMDQGLRYQWTATTMDSRALQSPDGTTRRAACWYHQTQVSLHLTFRASYSGVLRVYVLDWDSTARQEAITINDGAGPKTAAITTTFNQGAWLSLPINIGADGAVSILIDGLAGDNAVVSGLFLN